ncbi:hypothetical protein [Streptomyces goshikiensis]|uniref:hypothetical protein n=1 Tax=Streptomyces goshikiensis TaxID=1942 RepID=UPI003721A63C
MGYIERPRRVVRPAQDLHTTAGPEPGVAGPARAPGRLADRLRNRSPELLEAVSRLDAGLDDTARRQLADWIREHYEAEHHTAPVGYVAKCWLGPPYVDHVLDLFGTILTHYTPGDVMPAPYGEARMLARNASYACVEVYSDGLVLPVLTNGSVVRPGGRSENQQ